MTLADIAAKHGWTFKGLGRRGFSGYHFTKGDMEIQYSRAGGGGYLVIKWKDFVVPWSMVLEYNGQRIFSHEKTREEYIDSLLPLVTEAEALRRIEERLLANITSAQNVLRQSEATLAQFKAAQGA